jgi:hypothetical protein
MRAYCKILDEETGLVQKGAGCSDEYYQEIGMEVRDIKQSDIDSEWYLTEKCPMRPEPTAADRRTEFLRSFFKVEGFGYYRRTPKGYQSAIESINTAYNMAKENNGLPAGVLIFYPEPDFNVAAQCTEEWLVANQILLPAKTLEEFISLYNLFVTTWNRQEH